MPLRLELELDDDQARRLQAAAEHRGVAPDALALEAILRLLLEERVPYSGDAKRRALEVVGQFSSGLTHLSEEHDKYLEEIYGD